MKQCRICKGEKFKNVLNMGQQPLVNSLLTEEELGTEESFPLLVEQCQECHLVQIVNPISSVKIYREQDYLFYSSDMPGLGQYFRELAYKLNKFLEDGDLVVEIGSNDGVALREFSNRKHLTLLGVDPSTNVVVRALRRTIPTISDYFTERLAKTIRKEFGPAKVIFGANCIAHTEDLYDLMRGVKHLLHDDGIFMVECNYWGGMVKNKNYSLVYHDHYSYFTLNDWIKISMDMGLTAFDAEVTEAQGGSLRVFLSKETRLQTPRFKKLLTEELKTELSHYKTCEKYNKEVREKANNLGKVIKDLKKKGKSIAGYGAAAKGFSILSLAKIGKEELDFFVDDSPAKQGKYCPVTHIPIFARNEVKDPDYFFIAAPNYAKIIIAKEKSFRDKGGRFILDDGSIL